MAGLNAPFGRDDQPTLELKIVGGKQVEVAIDKSGNALNTPRKERESHSSMLLSTHSRGVPHKPSPPPWIVRDDTPPKKVRKFQDSARFDRDNSDSRHQHSLRGSPTVLPPIVNRRDSTPSQESDHDFAESETHALAERLGSMLVGFDTRNLKNAYLTFAGFDSTLTGFVATEQIEQVFRKCRVPVTGTVLKLLIAKFMSAHRPNWVNYEQLLKFISDSNKPAVTQESSLIPRLDLTSHAQNMKVPQNSPRKNDIPLKPNQVSPRRDDGMETGRQSSIAVKQAFQDRQDAQLLIQMEQMLKQVDNTKQCLYSLTRALEELDVVQAEYISSQKLKTLCQRHHLPFNNSLLDKVMDRLDPRNSGKVSWLEFISFVERAMPLSSAGSSTSSQSQTAHPGSRETPPSKPVWETRQPLGSLSGRGQVIPQQAAMEQGRIFEEQQRTLAGHLEKQSREREDILRAHQRDLDHRTRTIPRKDHLIVSSDRAGDWDLKPEAAEQRHSLQARHKELLRRQEQLIEQKRQVQRAQEELDKYIREQKEKMYHGGSADQQPHEGGGESRVECFARLAKALYLCDQERNAGFMELDSARRLVTNYNLVYQLGFTMETIENTLRACSTTDDHVSIEHLIDGLKEHFTL